MGSSVENGRWPRQKTVEWGVIVWLWSPVNRIPFMRKLAWALISMEMVAPLYCLESETQGQKLCLLHGPQILPLSLKSSSPSSIYSYTPYSLSLFVLFDFHWLASSIAWSAIFFTTLFHNTILVAILITTLPLRLLLITITKLHQFGRSAPARKPGLHWSHLQLLWALPCSPARQPIWMIGSRWNLDFA